MGATAGKILGLYPHTWDTKTDFKVMYDMKSIIGMQAEFVRVDISKNGRSGIIALDAASVTLYACTVSSNRKHGLELQVCIFCNVFFMILSA